MKKIILVTIMMTILFRVGGCTDARGTEINFESYIQESNPPGESEGDDFTFTADGTRYEVMNGYTADNLDIIERSEDNQHKLVMAGPDREVIFMGVSDEENGIEAVRACVDTDGKVYLFYSNWYKELRNLFLDDLTSSHILQMNMDDYTVQNEYNFPQEILVLTVRDGYVYTVENGRIYRSVLLDGSNRECLADLGYRGIPDREKMTDINFYIEIDGIAVKMWKTGEEEEIIAADFKYTDPPMEPNVLRRIHRAVMEEMSTK